MKTRNIRVLIILSFNVLVCKSFCQTKLGSDTSQVHKIWIDLNISQSLGLKVLASMQINKFQIDTLIKSKNISPIEKINIFKQLMNEREAKVRALLTQEQYEQFVRLMQGYLFAKRQNNVIKLDSIKQTERSLQIKNSSSIGN